MSLTELDVSAAVDRDAVGRFQDGEWAAFDELYERHRDRLLRYCQYRLRDRYEAEDVAQEAFVRAWRTMATFGGDRNFYPWLRVIAANLCTDALRRRSRSELAAEVDLDAFERTEHPEASRLEAEDDRQMVRQALARLNSRHQSALLMREDEGLAYEEIAARTGVSISTVESLLWRARQAFRREFTVLSAGEACLILLALPAALAGWFRHAGHAVVSRSNQRMSLAGFISSSSDTAGSHAGALTAAGVAVATVVAAAVGVGGVARSAPAVPPSTVFASGHPVVATAHPGGAGHRGSALVPASTPGTSRPTTPKSTTEATTATDVAATDVAATAARAAAKAAASAADTAAAAVTAIVPGAADAAGAAAGHLAGALSGWKLPKVVSPAPKAGPDPISLSAGPVTVALDPSPVTGYAHAATSKLTDPLQKATRSVCVPALPTC